MTRTLRAMFCRESRAVTSGTRDETFGIVYSRPISSRRASVYEADAVAANAEPPGMPVSSACTRW